MIQFLNIQSLEWMTHKFSFNNKPLHKKNSNVKKHCSHLKDMKYISEYMRSEWYQLYDLSIQKSDVFMRYFIPSFSAYLKPKLVVLLGEKQNSSALYHDNFWEWEKICVITNENINIWVFCYELYSWSHFLGISINCKYCVYYFSIAECSSHILCVTFIETPFYCAFV